MKYILLALMVLTEVSCAQNVNRKILNTEEALFRQQAFLLERSYKYVETNRDFRNFIESFVDTCTEYNIFFEKRIKPFQNSRLEPIILSPYLFNNSFTKVILLVLTRENDLNGVPIDYVRFVSGERDAHRWSLKLKERYVRSFSYEKSNPLLSDTDIFLRVLRTLVDAGYMSPTGLVIDDKFFTRDW